MLRSPAPKMPQSTSYALQSHAPLGVKAKQFIPSVHPKIAYCFALLFLGERALIAKSRVSIM